MASVLPVGSPAAYIRSFASSALPSAAQSYWSRLKSSRSDSRCAASWRIKSAVMVTGRSYMSKTSWPKRARSGGEVVGGVALRQLEDPRLLLLLRAQHVQVAVEQASQLARPRRITVAQAQPASSGAVRGRRRPAETVA